MAARYELVFRPPWPLLTFWFGMSVIFLLIGITVLTPQFGAPAWVRWFFILMSSGALICGVILSFAVVQIDSNGIASRHFRRWQATWDNIEAWSRMGEDGDIYLRTRDGTVRGFSSWCMHRVENDRLAAVLTERVGLGQIGDQAVVPTWMKAVIGLIRKP